MPRSRAIQVLLAAMIVVLSCPRLALGHYRPGVGRWLERDPAEYTTSANLYQYAGSWPIDTLDPTGLYETDVHFYMTYYIASSCGLGYDLTGTMEYPGGFVFPGGALASEAFMIAWATQFTDVHSSTQPVTKDPRIRERYHFRNTHAATACCTMRNSPEANAIADEGINLRNVLLLGIGIHALQDSFSHEGFYTAHYPDPGLIIDRPHSALAKSREMAMATCQKIEAWMQAVHGCGCAKPCDQTVATLLPMLRFPTMKKAEAIARWQSLIRNEFGRNVDAFEAGKDDHIWADAFARAARLAPERTPPTPNCHCAMLQTWAPASEHLTRSPAGSQ